VPAIFSDEGPDSPDRSATTWRAALRALVGLVYPPHCVACGRGLDPAAGVCLCRTCSAEIAFISGNRCSKCGHPLGPYASERPETCPSCRPGFRFRRAVAVWRYQGPGREMIHRWKYQADLSGHQFLVGQVVDLLRNQPFTDELDMLVAVPMHWRRRIVRRFNPSAMLACDVARRLGLPFEARVLCRVRNTPSQVRLTRLQRLENVRGAFRVRRAKRVRGRTVLLVDDVMTTCATAHESARALHLAGARAVYVATLAR